MVSMFSVKDLFPLGGGYVGSFRLEATKRLCKLIQHYCLGIDIKLTFSMFKVSSILCVNTLYHLNHLDLYGKMLYYRQA